MGHVISLVFPGKPISKDNRRFPAIQRGAPVIRIPASYREFEKKIKVLALQQIIGRRDRGRFPIPKGTRLVVHLMFFFPYEPTANDIYNAPKSVCDALEGIVYENDNQFIVGTVGKAKDASEPRIEMMIEEAEESAVTWWNRLRAAVEDEQ